MQNLSKLLSTISLAFAAIAGVSLITLALLVCLDVVGRYFLNSPLPFAVELIELLVAVTVMGALPATTLARGHVTVDLIENAVRGGLRTALTLFSTALTMVFVVLIGWQLLLRGMDQAEDHLVTPILGWPVYPVAFFAMIAAAVTGLTAVALLLGARPTWASADDWE